MSKARHARPSRVGKAAAAAAIVAVPGMISLALAMPAQAATPVADFPVPLAAIVHVVQKASSPPLYTVAPDDTLSGIAGKHCGNDADWTGLFEGNKKVIKNPDLIFSGEKLVLDCRQVKGVTDPGAAPVVTTDVSTSTPVQQPAYQQPQQSNAGNVNPGSYSGFQACVISRESGGNSQVMNSSGHYGLYQFSESTWEAYGGSSADFGNASVAEQNRVFGNAMAAGGESNWSPYDGC